MRHSSQTRSLRVIVFSSIFIVVLLLTVLSFFAAWARDEGTLGNGVLVNMLADAYTFFRQPTHGLFWDVLKDHGAWFLPLLFVNVFFWALLAERIASLLIALIQRLVRQRKRINQE